MLVDDEHRYVFLHIPKTGGQSIAKALGHAHAPAHHDLANIDDYGDYLRFCFVRDPIARFVSAYRYSVDMARRGHLTETNPIRSLIVECRLDRSIQTFVDVVAQRPLDDLFFNLHFRPQVLWIERGRPQFIGRTAELTADLHRVAKLIGVQIDADQAPVNRSRARVDDVLDANAIAWLRAAYHDDIQFLGFDDLRSAGSPALNRGSGRHVKLGKYELSVRRRG